MAEFVRKYGHNLSWLATVGPEKRLSKLDLAKESRCIDMNIILKTLFQQDFITFNAYFLCLL